MQLDKTFGLRAHCQSCKGLLGENLDKWTDTIKNNNEGLHISIINCSHCNNKNKVYLLLKKQIYLDENDNDEILIDWYFLVEEFFNE